jgi:adenine-specific DNA-methyltransferase
VKDFKSKVDAILSSSQDLIDGSGQILRNRVVELAIANDESLIRLLLTQKETADFFFSQVDEIRIFEREKFIRFYSDVVFLSNSYTAFKSRIGLHDGNEFIAESRKVVLSFPFKDCVLEGGLSREEETREEIFYNLTLAPDDVNRLLEPKVFEKITEYTKEGSKPLKKIKIRDDGTIDANLIIKGNNLLALSSLSKMYVNKVKVIYIDPPYNKELDTSYNDKFKDSSWLTFMKNRLEIAKKILSEDGLVFVQIDTKMMAQLKLLLDEIFGAEHLQSIITVKVKESGGVGNDDFLIDVMEYILCYSKNSDIDFEVPKEEEKYIPENEKNYTTILDISDSGKLVRTIEGGNVGVIKVYKHDKWTMKSIDKSDRNQDFYLKNFEKVMRTTNPQGGLMKRILPSFPKGKDEVFSIEYTPTRGKNKGKLIREQIVGRGLVLWLKTTARKSDNEIIKYKRPMNLWADENIFQGIANEGSVTLAQGKKPERLIQRIFDLHAREGDLVMDFFLGSGTSAAVAHKMNLRYIGIEQMDYDENDSITRLKNVVNGDSTGISKSVGWKGGGSFLVLELAKENARIVDEIKKARESTELLRLWDEISVSPFISYKIDVLRLKNEREGFISLGLKNQKGILLEILDMNALYVNLGDLEDASKNISSQVVAMNKEIYGL